MALSCFAEAAASKRLDLVAARDRRRPVQMQEDADPVSKENPLRRTVVVVAEDTHREVARVEFPVAVARRVVEPRAEMLRSFHSRVEVVAAEAPASMAPSVEVEEERCNSLRSVRSP
jgi:hypothetical protein